MKYNIKLPTERQLLGVAGRLLPLLSFSLPAAFLYQHITAQNGLGQHGAVGAIGAIVVELFGLVALDTVVRFAQTKEERPTQFKVALLSAGFYVLIIVVVVGLLEWHEGMTAEAWTRLGAMMLLSLISPPAAATIAMRAQQDLTDETESLQVEIRSLRSRLGNATKQADSVPALQRELKELQRTATKQQQLTTALELERDSLKQQLDAMKQNGIASMMGATWDQLDPKWKATLLHLSGGLSSREASEAVEGAPSYSTISRMAKGMKL